MHTAIRISRASFILGASLLALVSAGCGGGVSNADSARRAYLGLDRAIDRAMNLGFDGFNRANSANIDPQTGMGDVMGTLTVTGQVDQGASANKGMRLRTAFMNYRDMVTDGDAGSTIAITYNTQDSALPALTINLRDIPNGTMEGTLTGEVTMTGDLDGAVTLNLTFAGRIEPTGTGMEVRRVAGSTTITGTATSRYGTYMVNITR